MMYFGTALGSIVSGARSAYQGFGHLAWAGTPFQLMGLVTLLIAGRKH
jgi:predicted MFS family arabinose efflux permease